MPHRQVRTGRPLWARSVGGRSGSPDTFCHFVLHKAGARWMPDIQRDVDAWSPLTISLHLSQSTFVPLRHSRAPLHSVLVRCRSPDPSASARSRPEAQISAIPSSAGSVISHPLFLGLLVPPPEPCVNRRGQPFRTAASSSASGDNRDLLTIRSFPRHRWNSSKFQEEPRSCSGQRLP